MLNTAFKHHLQRFLIGDHTPPVKRQEKQFVREAVNKHGTTNIRKQSHNFQTTSTLLFTSRKVHQMTRTDKFMRRLITAEEPNFD